MDHSHFTVVRSQARNIPATIRAHEDYQSSLRPGGCGSAIAVVVGSAQPLVGPTAPALRIPPQNVIKDSLVSPAAANRRTPDRADAGAGRLAVVQRGPR